MKFSPLTIEMDVSCKNTFIISIFFLDAVDMDTALFEIGFYNGLFVWDILFYKAIKLFIDNKLRK